MQTAYRFNYFGRSGPHFEENSDDLNLDELNEKLREGAKVVFMTEIPDLEREVGILLVLEEN